MSTENNLVKAIYSFKGKNNDELCFKKGDIITVTQREEGGWWEGTLGDTTGWFPSNYVAEYKDPSGSSTTSPVRAPSEIQAFRNVVLKDIIDSEKAHVAEMQGLITNFLQPLENSDILTRDEFKQLTGNINEVLQTHEQFLALLEECAAKTGPEQRVGGLFLQWAPRIKTVHQTYCAGHPKAVCILDKYKEELGSWMEGAGAVCPGTLVLTAGLSKPFRRLGKYPAMLQELARHVHEAHPDRGDTHRASAVYKDIASGCAALRRQKELELQVVTGEVRGWPGGELAALGDVLHMGSVAVGPAHQDRYLVLFPSALLLLSVSKRVSAFVYEGCLPLTGITVCKLDDTDTRKNAFEISGPMIDTIVAVCQTKAEADNWVSLLQKHSNSSSPAHEPGQPHSLPHLARSPSEGALSSISSSRRSLYHVTLPPSHYPSASPYYSLTKYFARLVKKKVITRQMLRKLLHERTWAKAFEMTGLPVQRRHKNRIHLKIDEDGTIETETECSDNERDSDDSDRETDTTESCMSSGCAEGDFYGIRFLRQNALDRTSPRTASSTTSSCGSDYGYVRYFDNPSNFNTSETSSSVRGDCTREIFASNSHANLKGDAEMVKEIRAQFDRIVKEQGNKLHPGIVVERSDSNENSSFEFAHAKPYMACEDLVNLDQNTLINPMGGSETDFDLMRRTFPEYAGYSKNEPPLKLWKSTEEAYSINTNLDKMQTTSKDSIISSDMVKDLEPPNNQGFNINSDPTQLILDPPPMFRNDEDNVKVISMNPNAMPFRKHSINSDKKIRRSVTKSLVEYAKSDDDTRVDRNPVHRMSSQSETHQSNAICECCRRSVCHSPRSSDSGVVGSCTLASPDLNMLDYNSSNNETDNRKKSSTSDELKLSLSDITEGNYMAQRKNLTLSQAEAAKFEEQCRCTSPFSSTPRTSCENSTTSDNVVVGILDSSLTSVTYSPAVPLPSSKPVPKMQRTSIRANVNQHLLLEKAKPDPPPRVYRKPSTHIEEPKNVRKNVIKEGWSTLDISERTKPSLHYHMRIFRDQCDDSKLGRQTRRDSARNRDALDTNGEKAHNSNDTRAKKARSRSVELSKLHEESAAGFVVYRSDLYAHWWMKAKLPITVVSDSGKDHYVMASTAEGSSAGSPSGLTNHKRSHSFNNHQSYSQHTQQAPHTPQTKQRNQSARWLLNSCDSLAQPASVKPNTTPLGKFSSLDFIDTTGTTYNTKGWSVTSLRPAPPLRPQSFAVGSDENIGPTHPYAPHQRKSNSYEEDALILRVIEAYCTSAKCRNAVSSECEEDGQLSMDALVRSPSLPIHSRSGGGAPSLWALVVRLQNEMKHLRTELTELRLRLEREVHARCLAVAALETRQLFKDAKESKC